MSKRYIPLGRPHAEFLEESVNALQAVRRHVRALLKDRTGFEQPSYTTPDGKRKAMLQVDKEAENECARFLVKRFGDDQIRPNLMVGLAPELVATLVMAVAEHGGEVKRNPYHLRHPARLINNVRRGSEVVGGQGTAGSPFVFAELYRVCLMRGQEITSAGSIRRMVRPTDKLDVHRLMREFYPGLKARK